MDITWISWVLHINLSIPLTFSHSNKDPDKIRKVRKEYQNLIDSPRVLVRELPMLLGHLTSTIQAVFPGPLPLPPLTKQEKQGFQILSNLRILNSTFPSCQRGVGLVEGQPRSLEWESPCFGFSRLDNRDGCFSTRVGDILERDARGGGGGKGGQWSQGGTLLLINCL